MGGGKKSEFEQGPEAFGLYAAHRDLGLLLIVHAELETRLEPRDHFPDAMDVYQEGSVYAPESVWVQIGLQFLDGAVV